MSIICLELADAGYRVQLINPILDELCLLSITKAAEGMIHVFYQDGFWKEPEGQAIADALNNASNLIVCGTASLVYNLKIPHQVFADLEQYVAFQVTQKSE